MGDECGGDHNPVSIWKGIAGQCGKQVYSRHRSCTTYGANVGEPAEDDIV